MFKYLLIAVTSLSLLACSPTKKANAGPIEGAAAGAVIGSFFGPPGTLVGGVIGFLVGGPDVLGPIIKANSKAYKKKNYPVWDKNSAANG